MKHFPKPLISFRKLQGGQFGTLDVQAATPHDVQLALGSDFIYLTRPQWIALRCAVDRFFGCETETVVVASPTGRPARHLRGARGRGARRGVEEEESPRRLRLRRGAARLALVGYG